MKLNKEHIEIIQQFVKSKCVDYYDVQLELVDHFASKIENTLEEGADILKFHDALSDVHSSFGLFGFSEFVEEKQKQAYSKGKKLFLKELFSFFKVPQIILTMLIGLFFYSISTSFEGEIVLGVSVVSIILPSLYGCLKLWQFQRKMKLSLTQSSFGHIFLGSSVSLLNLFNIVFDRKIGGYNENDAILWTCGVTLIVIALFAQIKAMKRVHEQLEEGYPEAFAN